MLRLNDFSFHRHSLNKWLIYLLICDQKIDNKCYIKIIKKNFKRISYLILFLILLENNNIYIEGG